MSVTVQPSYQDALASLACQCAACGSMSTASGGGLAKLVAGDAGPHASVYSAELLPQTRNADGSISYSGDRNVDAVLIGTRWVQSELTFCFPADGSYSTEGQASAQIPFNDAQMAAARAAFAMVSSFTGLVISEIAPDGAADATFRLSQTASPLVVSATGYFPGWALDGKAGDIWFGRTGQPYYEDPAKGNWGFATIMHEIGHTLGLKHGMDDYTELDVGELLGTTEPFYGTRSIEYAKDGQAWSLMTYTAAPDSTPGFQGDGANQPQSYMQLDIAALQFLYGADFTFNAGDTIYSWDATTGEKFVNGVGQGASAGGKVFETLWDGGGTDTYDFSAYGGGITVDLRPGGFSTFAMDRLANSNATRGDEVPAPGNVANALQYKGDVASLIENAIGGAGSDRLIGNQVANRLLGGGGDDLLIGGLGSDVLAGGAGNDVADFTGALGGISVRLNDGRADILVANGSDVDVLRDIEGVTGTAFDDVLTGDDGANRLAGGAGGRDILSGGTGDDTLVGGDYVLAQVEVADVVRGADATNRSMGDALVLDGSFELAPRGGVSTSSYYGAALLPHATVIAAAAGSAGADYYRFEATAGARALFDIDDTNDYSGIEILDAEGNVLAANFGAIITDEGSPRGLDARLAYTFLASGTFFVRILSRPEQPVGADQYYTLNVSMENATVATPELRSTASLVADGGAGDDTIVATAGDDRIDGGKGIDTLSYANHYRGVSVDLRTTMAQVTGAGTDTIRGIENLIGTAHGDRLVGTAGANTIDGGGGSGDVLDGGAGVDTLSFASQDRGVAVSLASPGRMQTYRLGQSITVTGFENMIGGSGDDLLSGDAGTNRIDGGAGDDVLSPDALGRVGARDLLIGGAGSDTASFAGFSAAIIAGLRDDGFGFVTADGVAIARLDSVENLMGGRGNDRLTGNLDANVLAGGAGDDRLLGAAGDDRLEGGAGDDFIDGGQGADTVVFTGTTGVAVDLRITRAQDTGLGRDRLVGIENVATGSGDDRITGNAGDNVFTDGGGDDHYDGAGGVDTVDYRSATGNLYVDLALTDAQDTGTGGIDTLIGVANLVGAQRDSYLFGDAGDNRLTGQGAADVLTGRAGNDTLIGGAGDDLLSGDDFFVEDGADTSTMRDVLSGGAGSDFLVGGAGDDVLDGGDGDDVLSNATFASEVYPDGAIVGDIIRSDGGDDVIDGGAGYDYALLAYTGRTQGITLDMRDTQAVNTIYSGGVAAGSIARVETLEFYGGDGGDTLWGGSGYDRFYTGAGDDTIDGGQGNDRFFYTGGDDVFDGGEGFDRVSFEEASSGVTVDLMKAGPQDTGGLGTIDLRSVEDARSSAFGDTMYLNNWNNFIEDNGTGDDSFFGRGGDDSFSIIREYGDASTILVDGGDGNDYIAYYGNRFVDGAKNPLDTVTLLGGAGDDIINIVDPRDGIVDAGDGDDTVFASLKGSGENGWRLTLGAGRDLLSLGNLDPTTLVTDRTRAIVTDFTIGEDRIDIGEAMSPWLLTGYVSGADPFRSGHLRVVQDGADTLLQIDGDGFAGRGGFVTLLTIEKVQAADLTGADFYAMPFPFQTPLTVDPGASLLVPQFGTDSADLLVGSSGSDRIEALGGNDVVDGGAGDDILLGGDGHDLLDGGSGADYLFGGDGDDVFFVDDSGDLVFESAQQGTDTVRTTLSAYTLSSDVENLQFVGDGAATGLGNALANRIAGAAGNDRLAGLDGNDSLWGGAGDDLLAGGKGDDRLDGGEGQDTAIFRGSFSIFSFAEGADGALVVTGGPDAGSDTLTGVETILFADGTYTFGADGEGAFVPTSRAMPVAAAVATAPATIDVGVAVPDSFADLRFWHGDAVLL